MKKSYLAIVVASFFALSACNDSVSVKERAVAEKEQGSEEKAPSLIILSEIATEGADVVIVPDVDGFGEGLGFKWSQTGGEAVEFDPTASSLSFVAPSVDEDTVLSFGLTLSVAGGTQHEAQVDVVVVDSETSAVPSYLPINGKIFLPKNEEYSLFIKQGDTSVAIPVNSSGDFSTVIDIDDFSDDMPILLAAIPSSEDNKLDMVNVLGTPSDIKEKFGNNVNSVFNVDPITTTIAASILEQSEGATITDFSQYSSLDAFTTAKKNIDEDVIRVSLALDAYIANYDNLDESTNALLESIRGEGRWVSALTEKPKREAFFEVMSEELSGISDFYAKYGVKDITAEMVIGEHFFIDTFILGFPLGKVTFNEDFSMTTSAPYADELGTWEIVDNKVVANYEMEAYGTVSVATDSYTFLTGDKHFDYLSVNSESESQFGSSSVNYFGAVKTPDAFFSTDVLTNGEYVMSDMGQYNAVKNLIGGQEYTDKYFSKIAFVELSDENYTLRQVSSFSDNEFYPELDEKSGVVERSSSSMEMLTMSGLHGDYTVGIHNTSIDGAFKMVYEGMGEISMHNNGQIDSTV